MNKNVIKCDCGVNSSHCLKIGDNVIVCPKCQLKIFVFFNGVIYKLPFNKYKEFVRPEFGCIKRIFYIYSPVLNDRGKILEIVNNKCNDNDLIIDSTIFEDCCFKNYISLPEEMYGKFLCTKKSSPMVDFLIYQMVKKFWSFKVDVNYAYFPSDIIFDGFKTNLLFDRKELMYKRDNMVLSNFKRIFIGVENG
ncbi:MAG: hypothetical protein M0P71_01190 [Melioribacteraceae bacterium]|nr:hypothetical protein [Melioribacteraceae bacterium]